MEIRINPASLMRGKVVLPASKSISNRALIIYALSREKAHHDGSVFDGLQHISDCDDTQVMWNALTRMPGQINIKAAGTAMRFLTAYLCTREGVHEITGTARMKQRPIGVLVDALRKLGAQIEYVENEGFPPLRITGGQLKGGQLELPAGVSSQYVSALLMIGPTLACGLQLQLVGEIVSRPYIEMTLHIMRQFGAKAAWASEDCIQVEPGGYSPIPYYIESDWSASSYWYEMVALSDDEEAEVILPALFSESLQGDCAIRQIFARLGVSTTFLTDEDGVECACLRKEGKAAERMEYDFTHQPDLAQTLVATCAALGIPFRFWGLQSLKIKETDRMAALRTELGKLGYDIVESNGSVLTWDGSRHKVDHPLPADTYEDHRMAMAMAPLALKEGQLRMNNPEVVSKSYPSFWDHLRQVGFKIEQS
ncbi:MAG: 3-phosphoshikimate 1-carboxyvinyltransferase [Bacteroidaceae bacterium]